MCREAAPDFGDEPDGTLRVDMGDKYDIGPVQDSELHRLVYSRHDGRSDGMEFVNEIDCP